MDIELRAGRVDDIDRMVELENTLFHDESPWPRQAFVDAFSYPGSCIIIAFSPEKPEYALGYVLLNIVGDEKNVECEIYNIAVDPAYQGQGIGTLLMSNIIHILEKYNASCFLEVRTDNAPAMRLYEKSGFTIVGTRPHYYSNGADAYIMCNDTFSKGKNNE